MSNSNDMQANAALVAPRKLLVSYLEEAATKLARRREIVGERIRQAREGKGAAEASQDAQIDSKADHGEPAPAAPDEPANASAAAGEQTVEDVEPAKAADVEPVSAENSVPSPEAEGASHPDEPVADESPPRVQAMAESGDSSAPAFVNPEPSIDE